MAVNMSKAEQRKYLKAAKKKIQVIYMHENSMVSDADIIAINKILNRCIKKTQ